MKRLLLLPVILLSLAGCAGMGTSVFQGGTSITASIDNPVTMNQVAAMEGTYGVVQSGVINYFRLRQCRRSEVESVTNLCSRYSVKLKMQEYSRNAHSAIVTVRTFVRDNKQISAISAFAAAQAALKDFQSFAYISGVK